MGDHRRFVGRTEARHHPVGPRSRSGQGGEHRPRQSGLPPGVRAASELCATADLEQAVCNADLLVVGVPTSGFRGVLEQAAPIMRPWIPVVSLSKGLERGTLLRMTEVIKEVVPGHPVAALTGPNLSHEIVSGKAAASVVATEDMEVASAIQAVFTRGVFRVYRNDDVIGCEMGGALKNVIAIAAGIGEGLGRRRQHQGGGHVTGPGGVGQTRRGARRAGDHLRGTCRDGRSDRHLHEPAQQEPGSRRATREGEAARRHLGRMHMVAEGVNTATVALELADRHGLELPICTMIDKVVKGEIEPLGAYWGLTPAGHEAEPG